MTKIRLYLDKLVSAYLARIADFSGKGEEALPLFRNRLFASVLILSLPFFVAMCIIILAVSFGTAGYLSAGVSFMAMSVASYIFLFRKARLQTRKYGLIIMFYLFSVPLILHSGIKGSGAVILFSAAVLASLILNKKSGLLSVALNFIIFLVFALLIPEFSDQHGFHENAGFVARIATGFNISLLNLLVVLAVSSILEHLNSSLVKEKELQSLYRKSEEEIKNLNQNLEFKIQERTSELAFMNIRLLKEIENHKKTDSAMLTARIEADKANRAKSEFLAVMSHEIRTPMNAIMGYSDLLESSLSDPAQKKYIDSIRSSGKTLLTIINDILDLSKIEAGRMHLNYDFVETDPFFSDFEKIFAFRLNEKNLQFRTIISGNIPAFLYIDNIRLRQVILNLVGNAIKFTEKGEIILRVSSGPHRKIIHPDGNEKEVIELRIEISDTGIGISDEFRENIFEPFMQEKSRTALQGTGLGLAISKRLTEIMFGRIDLISNPGKGSTFIITIPNVGFRLRHDYPKSPITINPDDVKFRNALILVADDIEENRSFIRDALEGSGLQIIEADDGAEALEITREQHPDLVILDVFMPGMDGFEYLDIIKSTEKLRNIPVIAYSAAAMQDQKDKISGSRFSGLLFKPVKIDELYIELMNHLPHRIRESKPCSLISINDTEKGEIHNLNGLIKELDGHLLDKRIKFESRQPLGEVTEFGLKLAEMGISHNCKLVHQYGNDLTEAARTFNIDAMLKLIKHYDNIVDVLKS
jgi:signal transduction histidine kinase/CheY-like chemotaxis protein